MNTLLQSKKIENNRAIIDCLSFALQYILIFMKNQIDSYAKILALVNNRKSFVSLVLDNIFEQYLIDRLDNLSYFIAIRVSTSIFEIINNYNIN